jgi:hypothetical protein
MQPRVPLLPPTPITSTSTLNRHISNLNEPILMKFGRHVCGDEPDARLRRDTDSEHAECEGVLSTPLIQVIVELNALSWFNVKWFFGCSLSGDHGVGIDAIGGGCAAWSRLPVGNFFSRSLKKWGRFFRTPQNFDPVFLALSGPIRRRNVAGKWPLSWRATYLSAVGGQVRGPLGAKNIFFASPFPSSVVGSVLFNLLGNIFKRCGHKRSKK